MNQEGWLTQLCTWVPSSTKKKQTNSKYNFLTLIQIIHNGDKFQRQILLLKLYLVRRQENIHGTTCFYIYSLNLRETFAWEMILQGELEKDRHSMQAAAGRKGEEAVWKSRGCRKWQSCQVWGGGVMGGWMPAGFERGSRTLPKMCT